MTLGEKIAQVRKRQKMSQNELGKKAGTSGDLVGRYERNEVKPSVEVVAKIAEVLQVSIDYLVGHTDLELDNEIINRVLEIQKLVNTDRQHILFTLDALLRDAKARKAYSA